LGDINAMLSQNFGPAKIYDRHGRLLYEFEDKQEGLYEKTSISKVSPWVIKATIATEDNSFYENQGINIRGLLRAGIENFFPGKGGFLQGSGGSSITQQLVKNTLIPEEERYKRSVDRKVKEATLAVEITRRYSKDQILEWYLNQIYYGNRAYGIGAAAQRYFGVSADQLDLAQASLLAGIPQSPVAYDPLLNFEAAKARQAQVLDLMVRHGHATPAQAEAAKNAPLTFVERSPNRDIRAPHWVFYIQDLLIKKYGEAQMYRGGLRVITTLDLELQEKGQEIVDQWVTEFEKQNCGCHNGALVAIDNNTGQILAMVGSRDFWRKDIQGENNNATAIKQPGSAFKPAVYLAAFLKGWNPATIVWDVPKKYPNPGGEPFVPVGPTSSYQGPVTVRQALGSSLNAPAVAAAAYAGVPAVIDVAHKLGISTLTDPENYGVSIATGGANITLLDMTYMYATLANQGAMVGEPAAEGSPRKLDPVPLLRVTDGRGRVLYEFKQPHREQTIPPQYAYLITNVLSDDSARTLIYSPGLFSLKDGRPLAAKTGTQQGYEVSQIRSTWNFGYVPDLSVGVWVGNADGTLVRNISSASSSLRIWRDFMQFAVDYLGIGPKPFTQPPGIVRAKTTIPGAGGCRQVEDLFVQGRAPTPTPTPTRTPSPSGTPGSGGSSDGPCRTVKIDSRNGLLAGPDTPEEFVKEVTFIEAPPDIEGWTPGPTFKVGAPPTAVSTITPTPTPAPTLPPRVVTAAPSGTGTPGPSGTVRPGGIPGLPTPPLPSATATPGGVPITPTPFVTVTQPPITATPPPRTPVPITR
jgi:membrane peptidoglycan carboxypeptidase